MSDEQSQTPKTYLEVYEVWNDFNAKFVKESPPLPNGCCWQKEMILDLNDDASGFVLECESIYVKKNGDVYVSFTNEESKPVGNAQELIDFYTGEGWKLIRCYPPQSAS